MMKPFLQFLMLFALTVFATACATSNTPKAEPTQASATDKKVSPNEAKKQVRTVVRDNQIKFKPCFDKANVTQTPARIDGRIVLRGEIGPEGQVVSAKQNTEEFTDFQDTELSRCLIREFKALSFPKTHVEVAIDYPFNFKLGKE